MHAYPPVYKRSSVSVVKYLNYEEIGSNDSQWEFYRITLTLLFAFKLEISWERYVNI
jgi:hypothetical protein